MSREEENVVKSKLDHLESLASLAKSITDGAMKTKSFFSSARIHKVPEELRKLNESAYNPHLIAIGPLHHGKEQLQEPMEHVKMYYTSYLLGRLAERVEDRVEKIQECKTKMEDLVHEAKGYYAAELTVNDHKMAEMMLIDGCFILELLYASYESFLDKITKEEGKGTTKRGDSGHSIKALSSSVQQPTNEVEDISRDPILDNILIDSIIKHDLFLFENQIPFFVLEELFKLTVDKIPKDQVPGAKKLSLTEYVLFYFRDIVNPEDGNNASYFRDILSTEDKMKTSCCLPSDCILSVCDSAKEKEQEKKEQRKANHDYDHILHLLHDCYLPVDQGESKKPDGVKQNSALHCCRSPRQKFSALEIRASELHFGGVKFVAVERNNDVKFREPKGIFWWLYRATFEIPTVNIHNPTEPFLRNLIAFEQFCPGVQRYFTSYAKLMDVLINSEKDVEVLSRANVIRNLLGTDEDVCKLLNKLCKDVVAGFFFEEACQQAFQYSKRCWPRYMAYWRRTYFASPWAFKGVCLALVIFFIQLINFIRSFIKSPFH